MNDDESETTVSETVVAQEQDSSFDPIEIILVRVYAGQIDRLLRSHGFFRPISQNYLTRLLHTELLEKSMHPMAITRMQYAWPKQDYRW
jgi:hypothetical protein